MVRASIFLLSLFWTFCACTTKITSCLFVSFFPAVPYCSRSECEKRKAIWDACVADINQDPGQKKDFDTQMLAAMNQMGKYTQND